MEKKRFFSSFVFGACALLGMGAVSTGLSSLIKDVENHAANAETDLSTCSVGDYAYEICDPGVYILESNTDGSTALANIDIYSSNVTLQINAENFGPYYDYSAITVHNNCQNVEIIGGCDELVNLVLLDQFYEYGEILYCNERSSVKISGFKYVDTQLDNVKEIKRGAFAYVEGGTLEATDLMFSNFNFDGVDRECDVEGGIFYIESTLFNSGNLLIGESAFIDLNFGSTESEADLYGGFAYLKGNENNPATLSIVGGYGGVLVSNCRSTKGCIYAADAEINVFCNLAMDETRRLDSDDDIADWFYAENDTDVNINIYDGHFAAQDGYDFDGSYNFGNLNVYGGYFVNTPVPTTGGDTTVNILGTTSVTAEGTKITYQPTNGNSNLEVVVRKNGNVVTNTSDICSFEVFLNGVKKPDNSNEFSGLDSGTNYLVIGYSNNGFYAGKSEIIYSGLIDANSVIYIDLYTPNTITLNYNKPYGTSGSTTLNVIYGQDSRSIGIPSPTCKGYTFNGYANSNGDMIFNKYIFFEDCEGYVEDSRWIYGENVTLDAVWIKNTTDNYWYWTAEDSDGQVFYFHNASEIDENYHNVHLDLERAYGYSENIHLPANFEFYFGEDNTTKYATLSDEATILMFDDESLALWDGTLKAFANNSENKNAFLKAYTKDCFYSIDSENDFIAEAYFCVDDYDVSYVKVKATEYGQEILIINETEKNDYGIDNTLTYVCSYQIYSTVRADIISTKCDEFATVTGGCEDIVYERGDVLFKMYRITETLEEPEYFNGNTALIGLPKNKPVIIIPPHDAEFTYVNCCSTKPVIDVLVDEKGHVGIANDYSRPNVILYSLYNTYFGDTIDSVMYDVDYCLDPKLYINKPEKVDGVTFMLPEYCGITSSLGYIYDVVNDERIEDAGTYVATNNYTYVTVNNDESQLEINNGAMFVTKLQYSYDCGSVAFLTYEEGFDYIQEKLAENSSTYHYYATIITPPKTEKSIAIPDSVDKNGFYFLDINNSLVSSDGSSNTTLSVQTDGTIKVDSGTAYVSGSSTYVPSVKVEWKDEEYGIFAPRGATVNSNNGHVEFTISSGNYSYNGSVVDSSGNKVTYYYSGIIGLLSLNEFKSGFEVGDKEYFVIDPNSEISIKLGDYYNNETVTSSSSNTGKVTVKNNSITLEKVGDEVTFKNSKLKIKASSANTVIKYDTNHVYLSSGSAEISSTENNVVNNFGIGTDGVMISYSGTSGLKVGFDSNPTRPLVTVANGQSFETYMYGEDETHVVTGVDTKDTKVALKDNGDVVEVVVSRYSKIKTDAKAYIKYTDFCIEPHNGETIEIEVPEGDWFVLIDGTINLYNDGQNIETTRGFGVYSYTDDSVTLTNNKETGIATINFSDGGYVDVNGHVIYVEEGKEATLGFDSLNDGLTIIDGDNVEFYLESGSLLFTNANGDIVTIESDFCNEYDDLTIVKNGNIVTAIVKPEKCFHNGDHTYYYNNGSEDITVTFNLENDGIPSLDDGYIYVEGNGYVIVNGNKYNVSNYAILGSVVDSSNVEFVDGSLLVESGESFSLNGFEFTNTRENKNIEIYHERESLDYTMYVPVDGQFEISGIKYTNASSNSLLAIKLIDNEGTFVPELSIGNVTIDAGGTINFNGHEYEAVSDIELGCTSSQFGLSLNKGIIVVKDGGKIKVSGVEYGANVGDEVKIQYIGPNQMEVTLEAENVLTSTYGTIEAVDDCSFLIKSSYVFLDGYDADIIAKGQLLLKDNKGIVLVTMDTNTSNKAHIVTVNDDQTGETLGINVELEPNKFIKNNGKTIANKTSENQTVFISYISQNTVKMNSGEITLDGDITVVSGENSYKTNGLNNQINIVDGKIVMSKSTSFYTDKLDGKVNDIPVTYESENGSKLLSSYNGTDAYSFTLPVGETIVFNGKSYTNTSSNPAQGIFHIDGDNISLEVIKGQFAAPTGTHYIFNGYDVVTNTDDTVVSVDYYGDILLENGSVVIYDGAEVVTNYQRITCDSDGVLSITKQGNDTLICMSTGDTTRINNATIEAVCDIDLVVSVDGAINFANGDEEFYINGKANIYNDNIRLYFDGANTEPTYIASEWNDAQDGYDFVTVVLKPDQKVNSNAKDIVNNSDIDMEIKLSQFAPNKVEIEDGEITADAGFVVKNGDNEYEITMDNTNISIEDGKVFVNGEGEIKSSNIDAVIGGKEITFSSDDDSTLTIGYTDEFGIYTKIPVGGSVDVGGTTYKNTGLGEATISLGSDANGEVGILRDGKVEIEKDTRVQVEAGDDIYNIINKDNKGVEVYADSLNDFVEITAKPGAKVETTINGEGFKYSNPDSNSDLVIINSDENGLFKLTSGTIKIDEDESIAIPEGVITSVNGSATISVDENSNTHLEGGAVLLKDETGVFVGNVLVGGKQGTTELDYISSLDVATIKFGSEDSCTINGLDYACVSESPAVLKIDPENGDVTLVSGSIALDRAANISYKENTAVSAKDGSILSIDGNKLRLDDGEVEIKKGSIEAGDLLVTNETEGKPSTLTNNNGAISIELAGKAKVDVEGIGEFENPSNNITEIKFVPNEGNTDVYLVDGQLKVNKDSTIIAKVDDANIYTITNNDDQNVTARFNKLSNQFEVIADPGASIEATINGEPVYLTNVDQNSALSIRPNADATTYDIIDGKAKIAKGEIIGAGSGKVITAVSDEVIISAENGQVSLENGKLAINNGIEIKADDVSIKADNNLATEIEYKDGVITLVIVPGSENEINSKIFANNGENNATIKYNTEDNKCVLDSGKITIENNSTIEVADSTCKALEDDTTIAINENGKALLEAGSVSIGQGENILTANNSYTIAKNNGKDIAIKTGTNDEVKLEKGQAIILDDVKDYGKLVIFGESESAESITLNEQNIKDSIKKEALIKANSYANGLMSNEGDIFDVSRVPTIEEIIALPEDSNAQLKSALEDIFAKYFIKTISDQFENTHQYSENQINQLKEIINEHANEFDGLDMLSEDYLDNIFNLGEEIKESIIENVDITYVGFGGIDLGNINENDTYGDDLTQIWGYVESTSGMDSRIELDIQATASAITKKVKDAATNGKVKASAENDIPTNEIKDSVLTKEVKMVIDVTLLEADGSKFTDFEGKYIVRILVPEEIKHADKLTVVYVSDDGTIEGYNVKFEGNYMVFETTHFSEFYVLGTKTVDLTTVIFVALGFLCVGLIVLSLEITSLKKRREKYMYCSTGLLLASISSYAFKPVFGLPLLIGLIIADLLILVGIIITGVMLSRNPKQAVDGPEETEEPTQHIELVKIVDVSTTERTPVAPRKPKANKVVVPVTTVRTVFNKKDVLSFEEAIYLGTHVESAKIDKDDLFKVFSSDYNVDELLINQNQEGKKGQPFCDIYYAMGKTKHMFLKVYQAENKTFMLMEMKKNEYEEIVETHPNTFKCNSPKENNWYVVALDETFKLADLKKIINDSIAKILDTKAN